MMSTRKAPIALATLAAALSFQIGGGTGTVLPNTVAEALTNPSDVATSDARNTNVGQFQVGADGATLHLAFNDNTALFATTTDSGEVAQVTLANDFEITGPTAFVHVPSALNLTGSSLNGANAIAHNPTNIAYVSPEMTLLPGLYNVSRRNESQVNLQAFVRLIRLSRLPSYSSASGNSVFGCATMAGG